MKDGPALTIGRITYTVQLVIAGVNDEFGARAYLTGPRGATYALLPNVNNPLSCFPVAERATGRKPGGALDGFWFRLKLDDEGQPAAVEVM